MSVARRIFFILEAREWVGTPFHWGQRVKGHGVDCVQLVIAAAMDARILADDPAKNHNYPSMAALRRKSTLQDLLLKYLDPVEPGEEQPGDLVFFRTQRNFPMHLGVLTDVGIIHASAQAKKVVETEMPLELKHRIIGFYKFRGFDK